MPISRIFMFLFLIVLSCAPKAEKNEVQTVKVIKFSHLDKIINQDNGKIKVINFWATWCKPCVTELPQFESLLAKYKNDNLEMILVSFDFVEELEKRVVPFIKKKNIKAEIVLLDETDYNSFIDKVDKSWSGAIPATLMIDYRNDNRVFYEKQFQEGELEKAYLAFRN